MFSKRTIWHAINPGIAETVKDTIAYKAVSKMATSLVAPLT